MPVFAYKARTRSGDAVVGSMDAASSTIVANQLISQGIIPVDIELSNVAANQAPQLKDLWRHLFPSRVKHSDLIQFSRQMYSMTKAGVPILSSLNGIASSTGNERLSDALRTVLQHLESGLDLSASMAQCKDVFTPFYVNMVKVGETSGTLDAIFLELARYIERDYQTRMQVKRALRYPTFVIVTIVGAIFAINILVIPSFAKVFAQFHAKLPWSTRLLVAVSDFTVHYWALMLGVAIVGAIAWARYLATAGGRLWWDKHKLRLPVIGKLLHRANLSRFARLFAMATKAGVPVVTGLNVVAKAIDNAYMQARIDDMQDGLQRGDSLTHTAAATGMMDSLVLQMISIGEESGAVDELLEEVAGFYDMEVEYEIDKLSSSIEPILTVFIAMIALLLALGVFLPMWDMSSVALGHAR